MWKQRTDDFEDGVLAPWEGHGDVDVIRSGFFGLQGNFSGFLSTGGEQDPEDEDPIVCRDLTSASVFPPTDQARARVAFPSKLRN